LRNLEKAENGARSWGEVRDRRLLVPFEPIATAERASSSEKLPAAWMVGGFITSGKNEVGGGILYAKIGVISGVVC
jgi:hypothetical protein